jgi:hypothetical protein
MPVSLVVSLGLGWGFRSFCIFFCVIGYYLWVKARLNIYFSVFSGVVVGEHFLKSKGEMC